MKINYEIVDKRRNDIMVLIQKLGKVSITTLAKEFNVSDITIRRDLQYWEDKGAILRYHGGAKIVQKMIDDIEPKLTNMRYKEALAKYAANYVQDGDTIFINSSSTALAVVKHIHHKRVNVITNNARILYMEVDPLITVNLTGGELRYPKFCLDGQIAIDTLNKITATKCFLGCSGIDIENGLTTAILSEVQINKKMIERCKGSVFLLADYTKIFEHYSFTSAHVNDIDYLITDVNTSEEDLQAFKEQDIQVVRLKPLPY